MPSLIERIPPTLIAWDNVAPISDVNPSHVRLSVSGNRLSRLHPSDLADIIADLSAKDAARLFQSLDDETAADALEHLPPGELVASILAKEREILRLMEEIQTEVEALA